MIDRIFGALLHGLYLVFCFNSSMTNKTLLISKLETLFENLFEKLAQRTTCSTIVLGYLHSKCTRNLMTMKLKWGSSDELLV